MGEGAIATTMAAAVGTKKILRRPKNRAESKNRENYERALRRARQNATAKLWLFRFSRQVEGFLPNVCCCSFCASPLLVETRR